MLARYGGEEFVVILPSTPLSGGLVTATQLLDAVRTLQLPHEKSPVAAHVTISIGVAAAVPGPETSPARLVAAADEMLYRAKREGRNRVNGMRCDNVPKVTPLLRQAAAR